MGEQWSFSSPKAVWGVAFGEVCKRIGPVFARSETRERTQSYLRGLLSPIERKNGWQMAEEAGEATPYAMQYLLDRARWESITCVMKYEPLCVSSLGIPRRCW